MLELSQETISSLVKGLHIPAQPIVLQQLMILAAQEQSDIIEAAEIIEKDVELSALVLKAINSPIFGFNKRIEGIKRAVILLGFNPVLNIAMTCLLKGCFEGDACISLDRFWDESLESAIKCQLICKILNADVSPDEMYALGLFHDCGIAAMALNYKLYDVTLKKANLSTDVNFTEVETQIHGTDHASVGFCIASSWGLSNNIYDITLHHHFPKFLSFCSDAKQRTMYSILKIATNIISLLRNNKNEASWELEKEKIFNELSIDEAKYDNIYKVFAQPTLNRQAGS
jgi:HD-like signal output (HDOD) protein